MKIETWHIDRPKPYDDNPRAISAAAVAKVAASIAVFGFKQPLVVDANGVLIVGHTRLQAAKQIGLTEVPVLVAEDLTPDQVRAYRIADNRTNEEATWDQELLRDEMSALADADFELDATGFDASQIERLMNGVDIYGDTPAPSVSLPSEGDGEPEHVDTSDAPAFSTLGAVYELGPHRLMCGDSTSAECIATLMAGELATFCFTSPPYGQQREYDGGVGDWDKLMEGFARTLPLADSAQLFVNLGMIHKEFEWVPYWNGWLDTMKKFGWRQFGWYVWDQGPGMMGDWHGRLAPAHEFIWHFNKQTRAAKKTKECKHAGDDASEGGQRGSDGVVRTKSSMDPVGTHKIPDSVIRVMRHKGAVDGGDHPAVFPPSLPLEFIEAYTDAREICFEPFTGSGSSLIAAAMAGRIFRGMEISPKYCDVIRRRWTKYARKNSIPVGDGSLEPIA